MGDQVTEELIRISDLHFGYNFRKVFNGLNLKINSGERIGLVGPNGAGKTTLLYLIMGFLKPSKGEIVVFGKLRKQEKDFTEVRQKVGLLFQDSDSQLFCPTVKEDIAFGPLNLGMKKNEVLKIVEEIAEIFEIKHLLDRPIYELSGGEKRMVALAGVFAMNPVCYLLDEPSTGLDEKTTNRLIEFLRERVSTYLIVSHDKEFLKKTVDKVYALDEGKLVLVPKL